MNKKQMQGIFACLAILVSVVSGTGSNCESAVQDQPERCEGEGEAYFSCENDKRALNKAIPGRCDKYLRVATYNVNNHQDLKESDNTDSVLKDIESIDADVLLIQDIEISEDSEEPKGLYQLLKDRGYEYKATYQRYGASQRHSIIVGRKPYDDIKNVHEYEQGDGMITTATLKCNDQAIRFITSKVHDLDSEDEFSGKSYFPIGNIRGREGDENTDNYIVGMSFKDEREIEDQDVRTYLNTEYGLTDSFISLAESIPIPNYTGSSPGKNSAILAGTALKPKRAYVYHTTSSAYNPVVVDFEKPGIEGTQQTENEPSSEGDKPAQNKAEASAGGDGSKQEETSLIEWLKTLREKNDEDLKAIRARHDKEIGISGPVDK